MRIIGFGLLLTAFAARNAVSAAPRALRDSSRQLHPSSRATPLIFSEIHYHPAPDASAPVRDLEFIELYNTDPVAFDLSGYELSGDIAFRFADGTQIPPHHHLIVAHAPQDIEVFYRMGTPLGPYLGQLNNDGGTLRLLNRRGTVLLEVPFNNRAPWPLAAAGAGHSIVLTSPDLGESNPEAWEASAQLHGNPGRREELEDVRAGEVVINEVSAATAGAGFIELYNPTAKTQDLSGATLRRLDTPTPYTIPVGSSLPSHGRLTIHESMLGFSLISGRIALTRSNSTAILDIRETPAMLPGMTQGLSPDGEGELRFLTRPSPNEPNAPVLRPSIVISEIMYHPISEDDADEYVELYNRGLEAVDLSRWRFTDGISWDFPVGTALRPGEYLVVAKDRAHLLSAHPDLTEARTLGDYIGTLSDKGERLTLSRPLQAADSNSQYIEVNSVTYRDSADWGAWSDGDGSSLELLDTESDNTLAMNWQSSDETNKGPWTSFESSGRMLDSVVVPSGRVYVWLPHRGEALIDNVEVIGSTVTNLVKNPDFSETNRFWKEWGNHALSSFDPTGGIDNSGCYHLRSQAAGGLVGDKILGNLGRSLTNRIPVTIRFQARWLAGSPRLIFMLKGMGFELSAPLRIPSNLGTPGKRNSRSVAAGSSPPALSELSHAPILPAAGEPVVVTCRREDREPGVAPILEWKLDGDVDFVPVTMRDDGEFPDVTSGDGYYCATIPGQARGRLVVFRIRSSLASANRFLPWPDPHGEQLALVGFGEQPFGGDFGDYRVWMRSTNVFRWNAQPKMCNQLWPATFVWDRFRAIHGAGIRFSGSGFSRPSYTHPITGVEAGYVFHLPDHSRHLGDVSFKMDSTNPGQDRTTYQRTKLSMALGDAMRAPVLNTRYVHWFMNGNQRGRLYTDAQTPNAEWIQSQFPDEADGYLHEAVKEEDYDDLILSSSGGRLPIFGFISKVDGAYARNAYRGLWDRKDQGPRDDSFEELFRLYDTMNLTAPEVQSAAIESHVDVDEFVRVLATRHLSTDQDGFGYNDVANAMLYKSRHGKWKHIPWDFDTGWGVSRDPLDFLPPESEMAGNDQKLANFFSRGLVQRAYWRSVLEGSDWLNQKAVRHIESWNEVLSRSTNGVTTLSDFAALRGHVVSRATFVKGILASKGLFPEFAITNFANVDVTVEGSLVTLKGLAPVTALTLHVNGSPIPASVIWNSVRSWELILPLEPGINPFVIEARDIDGRRLDSIGIRLRTSTGTKPLRGEIVINEVLAHPVLPGAEFIELHNRSSINAYHLGGVRVEEIDYTIPWGTIIPTNGFISIARARSMFATAHGVERANRVIGDFQQPLLPAVTWLTLVDRDGVSILDRVPLFHSAPWPSTAWNGVGHSLQRLDSNLPGSAVWNWVAATPTPSQGNAHSSASLPPYLLIAELQSLNTRTIVDPTGNYAPWIEIFNPGPVDASFRGCYLSDDAQAIAKWQFPDDLVLRSGGRLIIWCDTHSERSVSPSNLHTSFGLDANGGIVILSRISLAETNLIHLLTYPPLEADKSFGLTSTADPLTPSSLISATPGELNPKNGTGQVRINEWMAANQSTLRDPATGRFEDWMELYNTGSETVLLDGWALSDESDLSSSWPFPAGTRIDPHGFLLIWADGQPLLPGLHASFKLSAQGETLALLGPTGQVIDRVTFGIQAADVSHGRSPDGGLTLATLGLPTPGTANRTPANRAPVLSYPRSRILYPGEPLAFSAVAADPDFPAQSLLLSLEPPFHNAAFNPNTGAFLWIPSIQDAGGQFEFKLKASDNGLPGLSTTETFLVTVTPPLLLALEHTNRPALSFLALSNRAYSIDWRESLDYGHWSKLTNLTSRISNRLERVVDVNAAADGRLYRLVTPPSPDRTPGPLLLRSPRSMTVTSGTRAELTVFAVGAGPLRYQWFQDGRAISGATRSNLVWEAVEFDAAGNYTVTVSNSSGTATNEPPAQVFVE